MKLGFSGLLLSTLLLASGASVAKDYTPEDFQQIFSSDNKLQQKQAIESLIIAGLTDSSVYDPIESQLLASLPLATNKEAIDYSAWLMKGLSYSGDEKYRATLNNIVEGNYHKKLKRYANEGLDNLTKFKQWNSILADKSLYDTAQSPRVNAVNNALRCNDLELMRIAAKRITNEAIHDKAVLETLSQELKTPRLLGEDKLSIDTYAHLAKALSSSGDPSYKPVIEEIAAHAKQSKLRSYASKYLKSYY